MAKGNYTFLFCTLNLFLSDPLHDNQNVLFSSVFKTKKTNKQKTHQNKMFAFTNFFFFFVRVSLDALDWIVYYWGTVLCIGGCLAASEILTHKNALPRICDNQKHLQTWPNDPLGGKISPSWEPLPSRLIHLPCSAKLHLLSFVSSLLALLV